MNNRCLGCMEEYSCEFSVCPNCGYIEGTPVEEAVHMEPGTKLADRYLIGKVLGYGGFGVTYIAWDEKLEQKVAIKEYLPSEFSTRMPGDPTVTVFSGDRSEQFLEGLDKFVEEAKRLSKFQNEAGIVKVFDSFKSNNTAYIVMEYLDGETLTAYMEREGVIPEDKAVEMLAPVMISLQTVHEEGILHRDIAPDNIFLTKNGEVKLIDFGASRYATTSHSRSLTVIIKPGYSPEEQYRSRGDQGPHTDVYALAAVMYKMITGITPPDALERRALIETKKKELLKDIHKTNKTISPNIENAILNAMNVQIEDRTPDVMSFMSELNSSTPVKRRYGKIKKIDVYAWPLWVKVVIPAVVVACLTTGILLATGVIDFPSLFSGKVIVPEGMVVVPDVEGMDKDKALEEITKLGLTPSPDGNVDSAYVEVGKIVLQTPQGGSYLEENGKVVLTVSSGAGVVGPVNGISTVPYVVWDTEADAIAKLEKAGLKAKIERAYDDNVAYGKVINQGTNANEKVNEGSEVTIIVSLGKNNLQSPSIQLQPSDEPSDTTSNITSDELSNGREPNTVLVPNVVGKTETAAKTDLTNLRFDIMVEYESSDTIEKGKIISQSPAANTNQPQGTVVIIYVSKGKAVYGEYTEGDLTFNLTGYEAEVTKCSSTAKTIVIPESVKGYPVTNIASDSFRGCDELTTVEIPHGVKTIGSYAFYDCDILTSVTLPNTLSSIEYRAFAYCTKLKSLDIPKSVTYIGSGAFIYCQSFESINLPSGLDYISADTFQWCCGLKSITIPNTVTFIGETAFHCCESLKSINIPDSVTTIDYQAFTHCSSLTSIKIPKSVTSIERMLFSGCTSLSSVTVEAGNPKYHSSGNCIIETESKNLIVGCGCSVIPSDGSVISIGKSAFCGTNIETVIIPNGVTTIYRGAFTECNNIKSITIPKSVTNIEHIGGQINPSCVLKVYENSYAHQYAINDNFNFELIS